VAPRASKIDVGSDSDEMLDDESLHVSSADMSKVNLTSLT